MTEVDRLTTADAEHAVALAVRAPSIHNTQPWRWRLARGVLELRADRSRQLRTIDPDGRGLLLSCGGALQLAVLGLGEAGVTVEVDRLPDPADPDLLARLRPTGRGPADERSRELAAAAWRRHTERRPFRAEPVPDELVDGLVRTVIGSGTYAYAVRRAEERLDLAVTFSWADRVETADEAYRAELLRWVGPERTVDGVPASAVPNLVTGEPRHTDLPLREFALPGQGAQDVAETPDERPAYVVLLSTTDDAEARLRAGEAYARLSVEAERHGLASSALTQALDLPAVRERLRTLMNWSDHPQMVVRVGWPPLEPPPPSTPRRPVADVLQIAD